MRPRGTDTADFLSLAEDVANVAREHGLTHAQRERLMHEASRLYWDEAMEPHAVLLRIGGAIVSNAELPEFIARPGAGRPEAEQLRWDMEARHG